MLSTGVSAGDTAINNRAFHSGGCEDPRTVGVRAQGLSLPCMQEAPGELRERDREGGRKTKASLGCGSDVELVLSMSNALDSVPSA